MCTSSVAIKADYMLYILYVCVCVCCSANKNVPETESLAWPLEPTKTAALDWFVNFGSALQPPLTHLNEGGSHDLNWFKKQVGALGTCCVLCAAGRVYTSSLAITPCVALLM
eukprot:COSAG05_NODE_52_length_23775_cov_49.471110_18_plen_112_part_00